MHPRNYGSGIEIEIRSISKIFRAEDTAVMAATRGKRARTILLPLRPMLSTSPTPITRAALLPFLPAPDLLANSFFNRCILRWGRTLSHVSSLAGGGRRGGSGCGGEGSMVWYRGQR